MQSIVNEIRAVTIINNAQLITLAYLFQQTRLPPEWQLPACYSLPMALLMGDSVEEDSEWCFLGGGDGHFSGKINKLSGQRVVCEGWCGDGVT